MKRILVVNHGHSPVCGIHDLGKRIYGCLMRSNDLAVSYGECDGTATYLAQVAEQDPDMVIVNYRDDLTPWAVATDVPTFAVLHQYEEATADQRGREILARKPFTGILALDPGLSPSDPRVHAVGRPIPETIQSAQYDNPNGTPMVGSFGFAFPHKGFASVAGEVNDQCDEAVFNLHMPEAYFNGAQGGPLYTSGILADIADQITKPGIDLWYTNGHFGERDLVAMLAQNDVNCLFYAPGQPDAGLSSAIDYLIAARRPMLLSEADMFRVVPDVPRWPTVRLGDVLANYDKYQRQADELYDRMYGQFVRDIERIVGEL